MKEVEEGLAIEESNKRQKEDGNTDLKVIYK